MAKHARPALPWNKACDSKTHNKIASVCVPPIYTVVNAMPGPLETNLAHIRNRQLVFFLPDDSNHTRTQQNARGDMMLFIIHCGQMACQPSKSTSTVNNGLSHLTAALGASNLPNISSKLHNSTQRERSHEECDASLTHALYPPSIPLHLAYHASLYLSATGRSALNKRHESIPVLHQI